jgi:hypothetical protein
MKPVYLGDFPQAMIFSSLNTPHIMGMPRRNRPSLNTTPPDYSSRLIPLANLPQNWS